MAVDAPIQKMIDELEIRNVIARLAHLADDGDVDEYVSLFTDDGVWQVLAGGSLPPLPAKKGKADIKAGVLERRAAGIQGPGTHTLHTLSTTAVTVTGDKATARSYMNMMANTHTKPEVSISCIYNDEFVRQGGAWKLASRRISPR